MTIDRAVTNAHPLIWFAGEEWKRLGRKARRLFQRAQDGRALIFVPTPALVEVSEAVGHGRVRLRQGFEQWVDRLFSGPGFVPADLTTEVVVRSASIPIRERGDRLIAATAAHLDLPLITRDPEIAEAAQIDTIW